MRRRTRGHAKARIGRQADHAAIPDTPRALGRATREIDRYAVWPGQACGDKVGHTLWPQPYERARSALDARFDLRAFHDAALKRGAMPLTVLSNVVEEWLGRGG